MVQGVRVKVGIVVLNYNGAQDTINCIKSLESLEFENGEVQVVVVDNSEEMNDFNLFQKIYSEAQFISQDENIVSNAALVFIKSKKNGGYGAGNNIGIKFLLNNGCDYIWVLNNDTVVDKQALHYLVQKLQNAPSHIGFLGNKLLYQGDIIQAIGGKYNRFIAQARGLCAFEKDEGQYDKENIADLVDYPVGASLLFKREFLENVGLFNETYFLYFEEMDYVLRAKNMGWDFDICYKAKVWHKEGSSTREHLMSRTEFADFINLKNRIVFTKRYFPCYIPFVYLSMGIVVFNRLRRGRSETVKKLIKFIFGKKS